MCEVSSDGGNCNYEFIGIGGTVVTVISKTKYEDFLYYEIVL
jgi:hypothetical protein